MTRQTTKTSPEPAETPAAEAGGITDRQMRHLHAAAKAHGITTDEAIHDYLTVATGRPVTSRKDLTQVEAAKVLHDLDTAVPPAPPAAQIVAALSAQFPPEEVGKLPKSVCKRCSESPRKVCDAHTWVTRCGACGNSHSSAMIHLDFVGHADLTHRLNDVAPDWTWRPFNPEELAGIPPKFREDGLWIMLLIPGLPPMPGFGDADGKQGGSAVKEAIGDALRNAAMRRGAALSLWAKGDREWEHADDTPDPDDVPPARQQHHQKQPPPAAEQPVAPLRLVESDEDRAETDVIMAELVALAGRAGTDLDTLLGPFCRTNHVSDTDFLFDVHPSELRSLRDRLRPWVEKKESELAGAGT